MSRQSGGLASATVTPVAAADAHRRHLVRDLGLLALAALALSLPSLIYGPGAIDSASYNHVWVTQFAEGLSQGQLYPRWLPRSFEGLGSPTFYFYPPLAFYLAGGFGALGLTTGAAINAAVLVLTWLSGAAMRLWLGGRSARPLLFACIYLVAPYHIGDWYRRAALAEYSAFVWLPLLALALEAYPKRWAPPLLALAYAGLIASHLPVALLVSVFLIGPMALADLARSRDVRRLVTLALALLVGVALVGVYLAPALTLQAHISQQHLWGGAYQPTSWSPLATASPVAWGLRSRYIPVALALGLLAIAGLAAARREQAPRAAFWAAIAVATAILALGVPTLLWSAPLLSKVQFPWRILAITEFAAITAFAMVRWPSPLILALAGAVALNPYARTAQQAAISFAHAGNLAWFDGPMPDAIEYLPVGFTAGGFAPAIRVADLRALRGPPVRGAAHVVARRPDGALSLQVDAPGPVTVRRFYFPAWQVTRDGHPVPSGPTGPGRLLSFQGSPGRYEIRLVPLPQERLGWAISLAGLAGLAGLTAPALFRRRAQAGTPAD